MHWSGFELPPGMPGISPALVGCIPVSVVGKAVAAGDAVHHHHHMSLL